MGKRKSGGTFRVKSAAVSKSKQTMQKDESDHDDDEDRLEIYDDRDNAVDSDDHQEEVLNLQLGSDSESGDDSESEDEEDGSDDDSDGDLRNFVNQLAPELKRSVLSKVSKSGKLIEEPSDDSEQDEDSDDNDLYQTANWGAKKKTYWTGDTADLEIGQDAADADDEEAAAKELHKKTVARHTESDYLDDWDLQASSGEHAKSALGHSKLRAVSGGALNAQLEHLALDQVGQQSLHIESISRNIASMSKKQKLSLLQSQSPEFLSLVEDARIKILEFSEFLKPALAFVRKNLLARDDDNDEFRTGVATFTSFLEAKALLFSQYIVNVVSYLFFKSKGKSTVGHQVSKQLLELRYAMAQITRVERRFRFQISLVKSILETKGKSGIAEIIGRLRTSLELSDSGNDNEFHSTSSGEDREEDDGTDASGSGDDEHGDKGFIRNTVDLDEEEERFSRMDTIASRPVGKGKKSLIGSITRAREETSGMFGDVAEFTPDAVERISSKYSRSDSSGLDSYIKGNLPKKQVPVLNDDYIVEPTESKKLKRSIAEIDDSDDGDNDYDDNQDDGYGDDMPDHSAVGRRRAPDERMNDAEMFGEENYDDDDGDEDLNQNIFEKYAKKKKEYLAEKKGHYTAAPRYGGIDEMVTVDESGRPIKRGATYEMIKNKGLTPHRKTLNRNPRVKKRVMYERALNKRKSAGHNVVSAANLKGGYEGQKTGINAQVVKSRKIGN